MGSSREPTFSALELLQRSRMPSGKPILSPPSPTLTNPDLVLPVASDTARHILSSPPRFNRRPPSPSYLLDGAKDAGRSPDSADGAAAVKKGRLGLVSRKMRSLKERTSNNRLRRQQSLQDAHSPDESDGDCSTERGSTISSDYGSVLRADPALRAVRADDRNPSRQTVSDGHSSPDSDEMASMPQFLAKYNAEHRPGSASDEDDDNNTTNGDDTASARHSISVSVIENGIEVQRRIQEEEEQTSAILSRRAEEILANAKKRLNLMEGNLRGARDLVAPLTAANLKRAASLGPAYHSPFSTRARFLFGTLDPAQHTPSEPLRSASATPDHQGHSRGYSDMQILERPVSKTPSFSRRLPVNVSDHSWTSALRSSKSYDSFATATRGRGSPSIRSPIDTSLEPLPEDEHYNPPSGPAYSVAGSDYSTGLAISRDCVTPDDLRSQMSSLKGKISSLQQRAREDSQRRRSQQSLRSPSSMTNDSTDDRTFASARASPVPSSRSHHTWARHSTDRSHSDLQTWDQKSEVSITRNAFAEQAIHQRRVEYSSKALPSLPSPNHYTPSASHQAIESWRSDHPREFDETFTPPLGVSASVIYEETEDESEHMDGMSYVENGESVYEDADDGLDPNAAHEKEILEPAIVPHEERQDAFDYQQFFLSSAVATYGARRGSTSSADSGSSTSTAKRPGSPAQDIDHGFDLDHPPPTPQTPERVREIEKSLLHQRTSSSLSNTTTATFKTATEHGDWRRFRASDIPTVPISRPQTAMDRPRTARLDSEPPFVRPHTVIDKHMTPHERASPNLSRDSDSDRADSGVGFAKRPPSRGNKLKPSRSHLTIEPTRVPLTPPMSPSDPVARAVNALLDPHGRTLGLKEKALVFGAVENLRKLALQLQSQDEVSFAARVLRQKLDDARRVLETSNVELGGA